MERNDKLTVSLGADNPAERKASLKSLALRLGFPGRKGDGSISQLLIWLADNPSVLVEDIAVTPTLADVLPL